VHGCGVSERCEGAFSQAKRHGRHLDPDTREGHVDLEAITLKPRQCFVVLFELPQLCGALEGPQRTDNVGLIAPVDCVKVSLVVIAPFPARPLRVGVGRKSFVLPDVVDDAQDEARADFTERRARATADEFPHHSSNVLPPSQVRGALAPAAGPCHPHARSSA